jgi:murein DD-endopeptidase MepM/ murein hydrolase activator NlpD
VQVAPGDTVYSIARQYGVPVRALIDANNLQPPFQLSPGTTLRLPAGQEHVVQKGDTLYGIARKYGVDMSALVRANALKEPYTILVGQRLKLPSQVTNTVVIASPNAPGAAKQAPTKPAPFPSVAATPPPQQPSSPPPAPLPSPPALGGKGFIWPVKGRVVSDFGPMAKGQHNDGINIAVPKGTPVHAAESGVVAYAGGELKGFGNLLLIKHADGWMSAYAHNDQLLVGKGDRVQRGQVIAKAGATGNVDGPQLHFELRQGTRAVNPVSHLRDFTAGVFPGVRPDPG